MTNRKKLTDDYEKVAIADTVFCSLCRGRVLTTITNIRKDVYVCPQCQENLNLVKCMRCLHYKDRKEFNDFKLQVCEKCQKLL